MQSTFTTLCHQRSCVLEVSHRRRQGPGNCLLLRTAYIVEYRWRASKIVGFILKFYPYFYKENKKRELWEETRETWLDVLSKYPLVTEFHFDATLHSIFCNENSDADQSGSNCNVFTCTRHFCGLQLLKDRYVQVWIVAKGWKWIQVGRFLTSLLRN